MFNKCNDFKLSAFENRLRADLWSNTPCKQIQRLSRIKTLNGPRVRRISPVGKEKVYGGNDLHIYYINVGIGPERLTRRWRPQVAMHRNNRFFLVSMIADSLCLCVYFSTASL